MNDITIRFLDVYNYLLKNAQVSSPSDFAKKIEISTSMMNEILKGRSNAGINPIQNTVKVFTQINAEWLLIGEGNKLKIGGETHEDPENLTDLLADKNDLIKFQRKKIEDLEKENAKLKKEKTASEYNLHVAEPREELKKEPKNKL